MSNPNCFCGGGTTSGVGQHPNFRPINGFHQATMALGIALHTPYGNRNDFTGTGGNALLQGIDAWIFAGAGDQTAAELSAAN
jgi:hypothetical protein